MILSRHLNDHIPSVTASAGLATGSTTLVLLTPYPTNASNLSTSTFQQLPSSAPNWPIYLGITLGTLGLACLLSLGLWIRSHSVQRRTAKDRKSSIGEEPLPLYQAVGVRIDMPVLGPGPSPPAYTSGASETVGVHAQGVVIDARGAPPAYVANREEEQQISGVVAGAMAAEDSALPRS